MKMMKHVLIVTAFTMLVGIVVLAADSPPKTCSDPQICGNEQIPYPFGIYNNSDCFSSETGRVIELICNNSKIYAGTNLPVLNISISESQIELLFYVSEYCGENNNTKATLSTVSYTISSKDNKFLTVGSNSLGYLTSYSEDGSEYSVGCVTRSIGVPRWNDHGNCSGIGCCQVDIPPRMTNISIEAFNIDNSSESCSYSFVVKNDNYTYSSTHLSQGLPETLPVIFDWTIGEGNCTSAKNNGCQKNSKCDDTDIDFGYRCECNPGFEGNPYDPIGCTDIDECENDTHECKTKENCRNTGGSHKCICPNWWSFGDGTKKGGCQNLPNIVLGVGAAFFLLFAGTFAYLIYHKRKFIKLKEKLFEQNGGLFLRQKLSTREYSSSQSTQIFTQDELKKATKNFDEKLIIGKGGFGTVFKGFLDDKRIVAIKKSKQINKSQIQQFIDEVVVLSQINHRNVVKLLGCCLETKVPLLVYEFVSNGTLSNFIHKERQVNNETWKTRLKIAAEVARALSYLHWDVKIPIIHSDVKSDNVLLDGTNNTARVSDFGASKLVPLDQTQVATVVQGTLGYLDPEFMQTGQLTDKSDVYSFGVVLVELLTGEKPFCFGGPENSRGLAMHFLSYLKKDRVFDVIQDGMRNEGNEQEIKEVAVLAAKCLRLRGEKRPSMKDVAMELAGMTLMDKQSWNNDDINIEESQYFLHESSSSGIYELGDSSKNGVVGYDSLKECELIVLDDGR